jgi:peptidoglycan/LPS O-acetylase OafA/YrhL
MTRLVGGIAIVALLQVGLLFPDTHDFVGSWLVMMLFGAIYAIIGGVTTNRFEKRRRSTPD